MKITNNHNLPAPLVAAVTRHPREQVSDRISVTELIQPPQIRALSRQHDSELTEDASDRLWALLGTLLHGILERNAKGLKDTITEESLEMEVSGWTVVGHYDLSEMVLDGECLTDWKLTSVWTVLDGVKPDWESQLNCYAELIRQTGREIAQLQIVAIFRDWSKSKAKYDSQYPQQQVRKLPVLLWPRERVQQWIKTRVEAHQRGAQGVWPDCTPDERWERPTQWAVHKKGVKKAMRLLPSFEDACKYTLENNLVDSAGLLKAAYEIVARPGASVRCENYCHVAERCPQWAKVKPNAT